MVLLLVVFLVCMVPSVLILFIIALPPSDAIWMYSNYIKLIEWRSYGDIGYYVTRGGMSCLFSDAGFGVTYWAFATL